MRGGFGSARVGTGSGAATGGGNAGVGAGRGAVWQPANSNTAINRTAAVPRREVLDVAFMPPSNKQNLIMFFRNI